MNLIEEQSLGFVFLCKLYFKHISVGKEIKKQLSFLSFIVPLKFIQLKKAFHFHWMEMQRSLITQGVSPMALLTFGAREFFSVKVCLGHCRMVSNTLASTYGMPVALTSCDEPKISADIVKYPLGGNIASSWKPLPWLLCLILENKVLESLYF